MYRAHVRLPTQATVEVCPVVGWQQPYRRSIGQSFVSKWGDMNISPKYIATVLFISAHSTFALTATLRGPGGVAVYDIPPGGATFDISVNLTRDPGDQTIGGAQMSFVSSVNGAVTLNGAIGGMDSSGTGTRFNSPEWDPA